MRWVASLVAETYRILIRGGVFLYPGDAARATARAGCGSSTKANPIAMLIEQAGGAATDGRRPHPRSRARRACTSARRWSSARRRGRPRSRLPHRAEPIASARRCSAGAACSAREVRPMSQKHPIISITGSSGAGTTTVKRTFEQIFRREGVTAAFIEGDAFHRYDRAEMKAEVAERNASGQPNFTHFSLEANELDEARGRVRRIRRDRRAADPPLRPRRRGGRGVRRAAGQLHRMGGVRRRATSCSTRACTGARDRRGRPRRAMPISRSASSRSSISNGSRRSIATRRTRGYSTEAVTDTILRRMHDYVHCIMPAVHRRPTSISSGCRSSTRRTRSSRAGSRRRRNHGGHPLRQPARHRFPLPAVDDPRLAS